MASNASDVSIPLTLYKKTQLFVLLNDTRNVLQSRNINPKNAKKTCIWKCLFMSFT